MKFTGWTATLVGLLLLGQWSFFLVSGQVPELQPAPEAVAVQNADAAPPATLEELEAQIRDVLETHNVAGAGMVLVDRAGIIWETGMGWADVDAGIPATAATRFRVGSVSKSFVGVAVMSLVEQGALDLEAEIRELTPEVPFINPWETTAPVRLVHVLEHTAGFDDLHFREYALSDPTISTLDGLRYHPASRTVRWPPGQHYSYSNAGPVIAAYAVEKVTGQTFEEYAQEVIFAPLGMDSASFFYAERPDAPLSKSYLPGGQVEVPYSHIIMRPSGAASMTPGDMGRFVQMLLSRGTTPTGVLLQPASVARIETSASTLGAQAGLGHGYGLGNVATAGEGYLWRGHDGGIDGFVSSYAYMPHEGVGFAYTLNTPNGMAFGAIGELIRAYLTRDFTPPPPPPPGQPAAPLDDYTGYYEAITPRLEQTYFLDYLLTILRIEEKGDTLVAVPLLGSASELVPVGGNGFRRMDDPALSLVFIPPQTEAPPGHGDAWLLQGILGNYRAVPAWQIWLRWGVGGLSLLLMLSALLFALFWMPWGLVRRLRASRRQEVQPSTGRAIGRSVRLLPLLAVLSLVGAVVALTLPADPLSALGVMSGPSVTFWALTWLFTLFSVAGLVQVIRIPPREAGRFVWVHSLAVALATNAATIFLAVWGVIGWRTWA